MRAISAITTFLFLITNVIAQTTQVKLNEGFESNTFPPQGWKRYNVIGANLWQRLTSPLPPEIMQPPIQGTAVARINYEDTGGEDWLITKKITGISNGDSLLFYMIKQSNLGPYPPDSLIVKVSTTDSTLSSFTYTLLNINIAAIPTGTQTWHKYTLNLSQFTGQNIFIAFEHKDYNGHGCAIDSIVVFNTQSIGISGNTITIPAEPLLFQNYPNPFNPETVIKYQTFKNSLVNLKIFDILGREIYTLINEIKPAGIYNFKLNMIDFPGGVYFYKLSSGEYNETKMMLYIK